MEEEYIQLFSIDLNNEKLINFITELESISYPSDEKASKETIKFRIKEANEYFKYFTFPKEPDHIIGFINGTLIEGDKLTHESMKKHKKEGKTLCIHSIVVTPQYRKKKLGTKILQLYIDHIKKNQLQVKQILLICKKYLISFYENVGFQLVGNSDIEHGKEQWYEMKMKI